LEYYAGILFLTTNRIGDFDEAFQSRVHISLHYPQLDQQSTNDIFKLNLQRIRTRFHRKGRRLTIDEEGILSYANDYWIDHEKGRWNGRQIRNGCLTALALAEFDAQGGSHEHIRHADAEIKLQVKHLDTVSRAYLDFNLYLTKIYGKDPDRRANALRIRALETVGKPDPKKSGNAPVNPVAPHTPSSSLGVIASPPSGSNPAMNSAYAHGMPAPANIAPHPANYAPAPPHHYYYAQPGTMPGFPPQNTTSLANVANVAIQPGQQPPWQGSNSSGPVPGSWQSQVPIAGQGPGQSYSYGQGHGPV
jgi:hypothetical protein